jgi:hypothetical protein
MDQVFRQTAGQKTSEFGSELWNWQYLNGEHAALVVVADDNGTLCGHYHALMFSLFTPLGVSPLVASRLHNPCIKALGRPYSALHLAFRQCGAAFAKGVTVQHETGFDPPLAAWA